MLASKANESVSECSKSWLCRTVKVLRMLSREKTSFKCDMDPNFQVANLNRNLTQFRPSEIHFQPCSTALNGSLDIRQPEMLRTYHKCVLFGKFILKSGIFIKFPSLKFYH